MHLSAPADVSWPTANSFQNVQSGFAPLLQTRFPLGVVIPDFTEPSGGNGLGARYNAPTRWPNCLPEALRFAVALCASHRPVLGSNQFLVQMCEPHGLDTPNHYLSAISPVMLATNFRSNVRQTSA